jgi:hypothetical protein
MLNFIFSATDPKPEKFCNRKHFYSLNCVVNCDHLKRVRFFTNRHCGSAHDSRIWEETHLKSRLAARFSPRQLQHLIGDEGFACSDTLLTIVREQQLNKITGMMPIIKDCAKREKHTFFWSYLVWYLQISSSCPFSNFMSTLSYFQIRARKRSVRPTMRP